MAITPRTILRRPSNLVALLLGALLVGALVAVVTRADDPQARWSGEHDDQYESDHEYESTPPSDALDGGAGGDVDTDDLIDDDSQPAGAAAPDPDHRCELTEPDDDWKEAHWLRHLGCMEARDEPLDARLERVDRAIDSAGPSEELALEKADLLEQTRGGDARLAFLEDTVDELGTGDGELAHHLSRALIWHGDRDDLERVRHLQLRSRTWMKDECEVLQTDVWARYLLGHRFAERPSPAAFDATRSAVSTYRARDCDEQRHTGKWDALAEVVGVGIAAEMVDGPHADGALIRKVAQSFEIQQVDRFCERAVPDQAGARDYCEERVEDELRLSR